MTYIITKKKKTISLFIGVREIRKIYKALKPSKPGDTGLFFNPTIVMRLEWSIEEGYYMYNVIMYTVLDHCALYKYSYLLILTWCPNKTALYS